MTTFSPFARQLNSSPTTPTIHTYRSSTSSTSSHPSHSSRQSHAFSHRGSAFSTGSEWTINTPPASTSSHHYSEPHRPSQTNWMIGSSGGLPGWSYDDEARIVVVEKEGGPPSRFITIDPKSSEAQTKNLVRPDNSPTIPLSPLPSTEEWNQQRQNQLQALRYPKPDVQEARPGLIYRSSSGAEDDQISEKKRGKLREVAGLDGGSGPVKGLALVGTDGAAMKGFPWDKQSLHSLSPSSSFTSVAQITTLTRPIIPKRSSSTQKPPLPPPRFSSLQDTLSAGSHRPAARKNSSSIRRSGSYLDSIVESELDKEEIDHPFRLIKGIRRVKSSSSLEFGSMFLSRRDSDTIRGIRRSSSLSTPRRGFTSTTTSTSTSAAASTITRRQYGSLSQGSWKHGNSSTTLSPIHSPAGNRDDPTKNSRTSSPTQHTSEIDFAGHTRTLETTSLGDEEWRDSDLWDALHDSLSWQWPMPPDSRRGSDASSFILRTARSSVESDLRTPSSLPSQPKYQVRIRENGDPETNPGMINSSSINTSLAEMCPLTPMDEGGGKELMEEKKGTYMDEGEEYKVQL